MPQSSNRTNRTAIESSLCASLLLLLLLRYKVSSLKVSSARWDVDGRRSRRWTLGAVAVDTPSQKNQKSPVHTGQGKGKHQKNPSGEAAKSVGCRGSAKFEPSQYRYVSHHTIFGGS